MHPVGTPGQAKGLPKIGQILGGKYEVVRLLGEGGMASVFEASHQRLQQRVAIKILAPEFARDPELVARFEREARAVARLRTKHVARVMDVDATPEGIPYIVMEFLEGRDLDAELQARTRLPLGESVDIVLQACAGMLEAHGMGIVHRDLKPANLFLTTERESHDCFVKVLDFGISKVVGEATRLTGAGAVMGTVLYMSPEQVRAQPNVDTRADIWALGVILYELLSGRAPWEGNSHQIAAAIVTQKPPDIRGFVSLPEPVAVAVHTMLQRDPAHRFATVREVIGALAPFAPMGSIGAGVAEQVSLGQSGSRVRPAVTTKVIDPTRTIPMGSRPSVLDAASAAARASHVPHPSQATPVRPLHEVAPLSAGGRSRARLVLVFAVMIGLVGAAGVVLILIATLHKAPVAPVTAEDAALATSASTPSSSAAASASSGAGLAPAISSTETVFAAPPSTGTAGRTAAPPDATSGRPAPSSASSGGPRHALDGGATRPSSTPGSPSGSPSSGLPSFL